jgi:hypothetical protein
VAVVFSNRQGFACQTPSFPPEVEIGHGAIGHLAGDQTQLFERWSTDEVPAVEDVGDREIGQQTKREWHRQRPVGRIGGLADPQLVRQRAVFVAEEVELGSEPCLERFENPRRINRYGRDLLVGDLGGV